jgi:H2-forming N5,N10-methylenetetrahydromethanopterin dehydrogenase-like enzyme
MDNSLKPIELPELKEVVILNDLQTLKELREADLLNDLKKLKEDGLLKELKRLDLLKDLKELKELKDAIMLKDLKEIESSISDVKKSLAGHNDPLICVQYLISRRSNA